MKKKNNVFKVTKTKLSQDCRNAITRLFADRDIKADMPALFTNIETILQQIKRTQQITSKINPYASAQRIRSDILALQKAINGLHPATKNVLASFTPLLNVRSRQPFVCNIVTNFSGCIDIILETCKNAAKFYTPQKGAPEQIYRKKLVCILLDVFQRFSGRLATPTPNGMFDQFIALIFESCAGEDIKGCVRTRRKLIIKVIRNYFELYDEIVNEVERLTHRKLEIW